MTPPSLCYVERNTDVVPSKATRSRKKKRVTQPQWLIMYCVNNTLVRIVSCLETDFPPFDGLSLPNVRFMLVEAAIKLRPLTSKT